MKFFLILISTLFMAVEGFALGPVVMAGGSSTGGGFAVSCPATSDKPELLQLLDFYEAKIMFGFDLIKSSESLEQDWFRVADRIYTMQGEPHLAESERENISQNLKNFFRIVTFVDSKKDLPFIDDVGDVSMIPGHCHLEQVALFVDHPQSAIIYRPLWNKLTSLEQAALIHHEIFGHYYRQMGEFTTETARHFISHAFAANPGLNVLHGIDENAEIHFSKDPGNYLTNSVFYIDQKYADVTRLQYFNLFGRGILAKTFADLPKLDWSLKKVYSSDFSKFDCLVSKENINVVGEVPVQGSMALGYKLRYLIKTDEPIRLSLIKDGLVLSKNVVTTCN